MGGGWLVVAIPRSRASSSSKRTSPGEGDRDDNGHGTHCPGTIFGQDVAGLRIGVAPGVGKALIGKVLGATGGGSTEGIVQAAQWAINNGANVISLSLGIDFPGMVQRLIEVHDFPADPATTKALEAYRLNINLFGSLATMAKAQSAAFGTASILVAAAGNESKRDQNPEHDIAAATPAAAEGFYSVGALGKVPSGFEVAGFSNTGSNKSGPGCLGAIDQGRGPGCPDHERHQYGNTTRGRRCRIVGKPADEQRWAIDQRRPLGTAGGQRAPGRSEPWLRAARPRDRDGASTLELDGNFIGCAGVCAQRTHLTADRSDDRVAVPLDDIVAVSLAVVSDAVPFGHAEGQVGARNGHDLFGMEGGAVVETR